MYELVQCGECSAEHLSAVEVMEKGRRLAEAASIPQDEDEFQQELEPLEEEEAEGEAS